MKKKPKTQKDSKKKKHFLLPPPPAPDGRPQPPRQRRVAREPQKLRGADMVHRQQRCPSTDSMPDKPFPVGQVDSFGLGELRLVFLMSVGTTAAVEDTGDTFGIDSDRALLQ